MYIDILQNKGFSSNVPPLRTEQSAFNAWFLACFSLKQLGKYIILNNCFRAPVLHACTAVNTILGH
jgi:hypothetical protein